MFGEGVRWGVRWGCLVRVLDGVLGRGDRWGC